MTTDEIRALIAKKISGQGSAIDVGNGLEPILNALCDAVDAVQAAAPKVLVSTKSFEGGWEETGLTAAEAAAFLGCTEEELENIMVILCQPLKVFTIF